jgi:PAS domain S-box-containing protein
MGEFPYGRPTRAGGSKTRRRSGAGSAPRTPRQLTERSGSTDPLDFAQIFNTLPGLYIVLSPELVILAVSDAYLRATMATRDGVIGQVLFDAFPGNPAQPAAHRIAKAIQASLERVASTGAAETLPIQRYDIRRPDGTFEERHWRLTSSPAPGAGDAVLAIIHQAEDVTAQVLRERALEAQSHESAVRLDEATLRAATSEALLADANLRRRLTLEAAEIGTWLWDVAGDRVVADANLARIFGMSPGDAGGGPMAAYMRAVHPSDRARVEQEVAAALEKGVAYEMEYRVVQGDGAVRWVLARGRIERDQDGRALGLPGVVLDITDRVRAERERQALTAQIERQARVFDTTLSSITDFAYIFDRQGRFIYANQALLSLWGIPLEAAVGKNFFDLGYPHDLAARLQDQIAHVLATGERVRDETPYTSPTGAGGYYEYILAPVRGAGGEIEVVAGSTRDITERRSVEAERERLLAAQQTLQAQNRQLLDAERVARAEAERVGHIKDEFLATLSHELRTPLNAILGWAQILAHTDRPAAALREGLATIERNAQVQKKLIEDLLDMSRIVSGKVRLDVHRVRLDDVVNAVVTTLQPTADAKGVTVRTVADTAPPPLWADENRLQQVVWNLLSNAIKFTPRGGDIEIGIERVGSQVELRVADTGIGMSAEFLPFAFDRFRQSDASTTRVHGGLGLGLAIVRTLVELHGGRVEARSAGLGRGSTFIVSLPRAAAGALGQASAARRRAGDADADSALGAYDPDLLAGLNVVVVDDELDGRNLVARILEECSATVTLAASAAEGVALVSRLEPDVLLSDIGMPETDGYELMRQVRALEGQAGAVPAAALTALARPEDRTRALMSGYQTHIAKPVDARELIAAVAALAGRTGQPEQNRRAQRG